MSTRRRPPRCESVANALAYCRRPERVAIPPNMTVWGVLPLRRPDTRLPPARSHARKHLWPRCSDACSTASRRSTSPLDRHHLANTRQQQRHLSTEAVENLSCAPTQSASREVSRSQSRRM